MMKGMANPMSNPAAAQSQLGQSFISFTLRNVNFNAANTDNAVSIVLPTGFTRYRVAEVRISGASADISTATCGVFTAAAAGGTAIVSSATAITVTASAETTNNNSQSLTSANSNSMTTTAAQLFFRTQTAQGSAATGNVTFVIEPLS